MKKKVYLVWGMYIDDSDNYGSDKLNDVWHMGLFTDYDKAVKVAKGLEKVEKHFWNFYDIIDNAFVMLSDGKEPDEVAEKIKKYYRTKDRGSHYGYYVRELPGRNYFNFVACPLTFPENRIMTNE